MRRAVDAHSKILLSSLLEAKGEVNSVDNNVRLALPMVRRRWALVLAGTDAAWDGFGQRGVGLGTDAPREQSRRRQG